MIEGLDWHGFDEFTCLGELEELLPADGASPQSLQVLASILVGLKYNTSQRPERSLHVYVALGLSASAHNGFVDSKTLVAFYEHFFDAGVSSEDLRKFFSANVTLMVVRRLQYRPDAFHLEIVGAVTFSRPRDQVPTYLAYMAVSDGLNKFPSLTDASKIHKIPKGSFPAGSEPPTGYQGFGLGGFMIETMEKLVKSSIQRGSKDTKARRPFPDCYLHYNTNNLKSADGWLKLGFVPLFDESQTAEDSAPLQQHYVRLEDALGGCNIFEASNDDLTNCTTMVTVFSLPPALPDTTTEEIPPWFISYKPKLEAKFVAQLPSTPFYQLNEDEIVAKYTDPLGTPHPARCSEILEMALERYKFCGGHKYLTEGKADEELASEPTTPSSSSSSSSSASSSEDDEEVDSDDPVSLLTGVSTKEETRRSKQKKRRNKQRKKLVKKEFKKAKKKARTERRNVKRVKHLPTRRSDLGERFTGQEFIDYACLQDQRRTIQVDPGSIVQTGREKLLTVFVDSYVLPEGVSLHKAVDDKMFLDVAVNPIRCNWEWLRKEIVPEVLAVLEEKVFGLPIVEGVGLDHVDPDVARRDVDTMSSFHGKHSFATGFVSPPISHVRVKIPVDLYGEKEYGRRDSHAEPLEEMRKHEKLTRLFFKHVKYLKIKEEPPPLPRSRYQISRLKWIPTDDKTADRMKIGYFQGAYRVPNTSHYSVVSLLDNWVHGEFEKTYITDVKEQAIRGSRSARKLVEIPPGDPRPQDEQPAPYLLLYMRPSVFQQKDNSTCLVDAFCSAAHAFGCVFETSELRKKEQKSSLSAANKDLWGDFANLVNRHFKPNAGLQIFKESGLKTVEEMMQCDDSFVIIASLKANDGSEGQHAVAILDGAIYDANCEFAMRKSQESLDWCCGGAGVVCTGFHRVYKLLPTNHRNVREEDRFVFKKRNKQGKLVRGWIVSNRSVCSVIQFTDGEKREATPFEVANFTRIE
jgi:hypothetical protein